jgi:sugar lactone lactonase YvrE
LKIKHLNLLLLLLVTTIVPITIVSCQKGDSPDTPVTPPIPPPVVTIPIVVPPTLTGFSPAKALPNAAITITGTNFSTDVAKNSVTIGGVAATVHTASATQLVATIPATVKSGKVVVVSDGTTLTSATDFTVTTGTQSTFSNTYFDHIAIDASGNVYGDVSGNSIYKTTVTATGAATLLAGNISISNPFKTINGAVLDAAGNIYTADLGNSKVFKITAAGVVTVLAGSSKGFTDGMGTAAQFLNPSAITIDPSGNLYVSDAATIRKITPGGLVSTIAGTTNQQSSIDGQGTAARFGVINGLASDSKGNIYVSDLTYRNIRKITPDGAVTTIAGDYSQAQAFKDGLGKAAQFWGPGGLAIDASGNIFISDVYGGFENRIRMINTAGYVSTFMKTVSTHPTLVNGPLDVATIEAPTGLAFDAAGNLYICNAGSYITLVSKVIFN